MAARMRSTARMLLIFATFLRSCSCDTSFRSMYEKVPAVRGLDLLEDWSVSFINAEKTSDKGITFTFHHGSGGTPGFKIYGGSYDPSASELVGETCRTRGAQEQSPLPGMTTFPASGPDEYIVEVVANSMEAIADPIKDYDGGDTILQYCVYFYMTNDDTGEEANYVETEVRLKISPDGLVTVQDFASTYAEPSTEGFTSTMSGLEGFICKHPNGQGDTVGICISSSDPMLIIDNVYEFTFETNDGGVTTQTAFSEGQESRLTEIVLDDGTDFHFNTILRADFYRASNQETTVTGYGVCSVSLTDGTTRRLSTQENANVRFDFKIGETDQRSSRLSADNQFTSGHSNQFVSDHGQKPPNDGDAVTSNWLILNTAFSFFASMLSVVAVVVAIQRRRPSRHIEAYPKASSASVIARLCDEELTTRSSSEDAADMLEHFDNEAMDQPSTLAVF